MAGDPPKPLRSALKSRSGSTAQQGDQPESSAAAARRHGEQSEEQEQVSTPTSVRFQLATPSRPLDKGKGKAVVNPDSAASNRSLSKLSAREERPTPLKNKVSFVMPSFTRSPAAESGPGPAGSTEAQGGFYVNRQRPATPTSILGLPQSSQTASRFTQLATPIRRQGQGFQTGLSPLVVNENSPLSPASPLATLQRNRKPNPINVIVDEAELASFPQIVHVGIQDDEESESAGSWSPIVRSKKEGKALAVLGLEEPDAYGPSPSRQSGSRFSAGNASMTEMPELKMGKANVFIKKLFAPPEIARRSTLSPEGQDTQNREEGTILSPSQTNISNSSRHDVDPSPKPIRRSLFTSSPFKSLHKGSPTIPKILSPSFQKLQSKASGEIRDLALQDKSAGKQESSSKTRMENHIGKAGNGSSSAPLIENEGSMMDISSSFGVAQAEDKKGKGATAVKDDDNDSEGSSSDSSGFLTSLRPLPEDQVIELPRAAPSMPSGAQIYHPTEYYTDREYGVNVLGYRGLQDGVPSGLDSLLSIGGYGRRLRVHALVASNERFRSPGWYKPYEVEKWATQQAELFLPNIDDHRCRPFHDTNFNKDLGFERPWGEITESLPDLRSADEVTKPLDAAAPYRLPPIDYPLKRFDLPMSAFSYAPGAQHVTNSDESLMDERFFAGLVVPEVPAASEVFPSIEHEDDGSEGQLMDTTSDMFVDRETLRKENEEVL